MNETTEKLITILAKISVMAENLADVENELKEVLGLPVDQEESQPDDTTQ